MPPPNQERSLLVISGFLFVASAYSHLQRIADEKRKKLTSGRASLLPVGVSPDSNVSDRCIRAVRPPIPYLEAFLTGLGYPCDPNTRPDGFVIMCMAENKLVIDLLVSKLAQAPSTRAAFSDPIVYCYNSFLGLPLARQAAAYFIAKRFLYPDATSLSTDQALTSINPEHVGLGSGAAGILNSLFYLLGDQGDACLIPAPYYAAFDSDMSVRCCMLYE
jgi:1-aminocyclopropane-1-carboxylate synthase